MRTCWVILLAMLAIMPCEAKKKKEKAPQRIALSVAQQRRLDYIYGEAKKQELQGNYTAAFDLYRHCLAIDSTCAEAIFALAPMYAATQRDSMAGVFYQRASVLEPKNPEYTETLVLYYMNRYNMEQAMPELEKLIQLQPKRTEVMRAMMDYYQEQEDFEQALKQLDRIELLEGRSMNTVAERCEILRKQQKSDECMLLWQSFAKEQPHDSRIMMQIAIECMRQEKMSEAWEALQYVKQNDPHLPSLPLVFIEYYEMNNQPDSAATLCDSVLYNPETDDDIRYHLAIMTFQRIRGTANEYELMTSMMDSLITCFPTSRLHELRVGYLTSKKASKEMLVEAHHKWLQTDPTNSDALGYLMPYYFEQRNYEKLESICRMGNNIEPENLFYSYYLAIVLAQQKRHEETVEVLQNALHQVNEDTDPSVVSDFYELIGSTYHEMGRIEESYAAYDSCLVYNENNAACLNNYAYFLALTGEDLEKADRMSYRAIKLEPLNKTYLDTYAWVLFAKGNDSMAKFYIDRVISPYASDKEILESEEYSNDVILHAADIYDKCNLPEQAQRYRSLAQQKE